MHQHTLCIQLKKMSSSWATSKMKAEIGISFLLGICHVALYVILCFTFFAYYENNFPGAPESSPENIICYKIIAAVLLPTSFGFSVLYLLGKRSEQNAVTACWI